MSKILITGVTGNLGQNVAQEIIKKISSKNIVLMLRKISKANQDFFQAGVELRYGDYDNYSSLVQAFQGIEKLYFVSSSETAKRSVQHLNVVQAAKTANIKHIVYTSYLRKMEDASSPMAYIGAGHLVAERAIFESGIPFTILKQALYFENIPWLVGKDVFKKGSFALPAKDGKVAFAAREDFSMAAVNILLSDNYKNKIYTLSGAQKYSFYDIADILSQIFQKKIIYNALTPEEYLQQMYENGFELAEIDRPMALSKAIALGECEIQTNDLEDILGYKPKDLVSFLEQIYKK